MEKNLCMNAETAENSMCDIQKCLAYAFVNPQKFSNIYSINDALCNGTLFKDLNLPITVYGK